MKKKLLIRTDGSTQIGLGHLVRCISLAQILRDDFDIEFVCKQIPNQLAHELRKESFDLIKIKNDSSFLKKIDHTSIVVLDGYHFDLQYQKKIKNSGSKLVMIDDLHDKKFLADLIINHAPGVQKQDYSAESYSKFALGPEYALLRSSFLKVAKKDRKVRNNSSILICFGGSDVKNLTKSVFDVVSRFERFKKIIIVTGSAYKFQKDLQRHLKDDNRVEYCHGIDEIKMVELMLNAGVAVVPCSGIVFEALAAGIKCISGIYNENQKEVYEGFKQTNAIIDGGTFTIDELTKSIEKIDDFQFKKVIDGKSPIRIKKLFKNL